MNKLPKIPLLIFIIVAICFLTFQITYVETNNKWQSKIDKMISTTGSRLTEPLYKLIDTVEANSVYSGSETELSEGVMKGYVDALPDKFSMFMNRRNYQDYLSMSGVNTNIGIGVSTLYDETRDGVYVVNVYRTSPAEQNGIVPGDIITNVNDYHVKNLGYYSTMKMLGGGEINEPVKVTVKKRDGTNRVLMLAKSDVVSENITGERLDSKIGLIKINRFGAGDEENFKKVLENLIKSGREKFVIDVRNNPGGNIETISRILDFILPEGPMFSVYDRSGAANTMTSDSASMPYPIAVLINENTVSGAEVFASTLGSFGNIKLVGEKTYGKASTQSVFSLASGDGVCLSTNKYIASAGEDFDGVGVVPHIESTLSDELKAKYTTMTNDEDIQLAAAIEYLKTQEMSDILD